MAERQTGGGLREWRERHDVTLEETADLVGYSSSFLSRLERGERRLKPLERIRVARALGCRVGDLFPARETAE